MKKKQVEKPPNVEEENMKETTHSKSGVLKSTKKPTKKPTDSPIKKPIQDSVIESVEPKNVDSSNPISSQKGLMKIRRPQFNNKGVLFCEVSIPVSLASKKRQALDMAHKLQKNKCKIPVLLDNVKVKTDQDSDSERSYIRIEDSFTGSPQMDSPIKSNFEVTRNPDVNVNLSNIDKNIISSDHQPTSIREKTLVLLYWVSHTESNTKEV
ncbi:unnamed protein product [Lactuca saligna]|uniref:Uncharacterized protein n=1 Tax=Lactuca saligna TaxID=75948 RepID=A0AA35Z727_LACSI|nr:unnamed protein product [Lactuca saligna]